MQREFALIAAFLLSGCAASTDYTLRSEPIGRQISTATAGLVSVQSAWADSTVTVSPEDSNLDGPLRLRVTVENTSDRPADFGTENVFVSYGGQTWVPAKSFLHLKATLDSRAQVLEGIADAVGIAKVVGIAAQRHTPGDKKAQEIDDTIQDVQDADTAIDTAHDADVARLEGSVLQTTTIAPGYSLEGHIIADAPPLAPNHPMPIFVKINFGQDTHIVRFDAIGPWDSAPIPVAQNEIASLETKEAENGVTPRVETADSRDLPQLQAALCTKEDGDIARTARDNGFVYHSPCN